MLEGMDVDEAQRLAQQLGANAQALAHITAALGGLAEELSYCWRGPASATFQYEWTARYHAMLSAAAQALADAHARLLANIGQQTQASAADSGFGLAGGILSGIGLSAILGGISRGWADLQTGAGWEGLAQTPLDKIAELAGTDDVPVVLRDGSLEEDYGKQWSRLLELDHDSPFLKYKESPILNSLHDNTYVQRAGEILGDSHPAAVLGTLDKAGKGLGYVTTGVDGALALNDLREGHYGSAAGSAIDATSSALMNSDNPVGFLAGFDIALYKKDYELASQIDWKQGIPNPFNAANFRNDYIPTFKSLPGQLVSTLAEVI